MLVWLIVAITLTAVAGLALITIGWRGRPVSTDPLCSRCGFDLRGRFPWGAPTCPTCPDCGTLLIRYKSVMNGERRRRPRLLAIGVGLVFPAVIVLLANAVDTVAGGTLATIKPTSLIAAQVAGSTKASANLRALTVRIAEGKTQATDTAQVIERALTLQADRSMPLDREWLYLLEIARRRGQLTPDQLQRYYENAVDWRLFTKTAPGNEPLLFALQGFADRLAERPADAPPVVLTVEYQAGTLADEPLRVGRTKDLFGMTARTSPLNPGTLLELFGQPGDAKSARTASPLRTTWKMAARAGNTNGPVIASWIETVGTTTATNSANASSRPVFSAGSQAELERLLAFGKVHLERDAEGACWASIDLRAVNLPVDVVATLVVTTEDGLEYRSLAPVEITPSDPLWTLRTTASPVASPWNVRVRMDGAPLGATATVELRPHANPDGFSLASTVWRGTPLKFAGVQLDWSGPTGGVKKD